MRCRMVNYKRNHSIQKLSKLPVKTTKIKVKIVNKKLKFDLFNTTFTRLEEEEEEEMGKNDDSFDM